MRFHIGTKFQDMNVGVEFDDRDEIDEALEALDFLHQRMRIRQIKELAAMLWSFVEGREVVNKQVKETSHRIALSLLKGYPESTRTSDIAKETGLADSTVSNNLVGRRGGVGHWFEEHGEGWRLSEDGYAAMTREVLPQYLEDEDIDRATR